MDNFQYWYHEIADMPVQCEREGWYDLETGISYKDYLRSLPPPKKTVDRIFDSEQLERARKIAKKYGGKALKGTSKQKAWAEMIRYEALLKANENQAKILCNIGIFSRAKFWIENREDKKIHEKSEVAFELIKTNNMIVREMNLTSLDDPKLKELMKGRDAIILELKKLFKYVGNDL